MGIVNVAPFRGLDHVMRRVNEVFEDINRGGVRLEVGDFTPRVDISDDATALTVQAELPGVSKEDVKITIGEGNVLTIRGEKKHAETHKDGNHVRLERSYGSFTRSFALPDNLQKDAVTASFENGVLTLTIPKAEPAAPKEQEISIS